jgi:hypothetical protein
MTDHDPYIHQKNYQARIRAKAQLFDIFNDHRQHRIRRQIIQLRMNGPVRPEIERLFPYYLSFPQVQQITIPQQSADRRATRRSYDPDTRDPVVPVWVAEKGDDWDVGVAAYAFATENPGEPFRFASWLRGHVRFRTHENTFAGDLARTYTDSVGRVEDLLRQAGAWVTE